MAASPSKVVTAGAAPLAAIASNRFWTVQSWLIFDSIIALNLSVLGRGFVDFAQPMLAHVTTIAVAQGAHIMKQLPVVVERCVTVPDTHRII